MSTSRSGTSKKKTVERVHPKDGNIPYHEAFGFNLGDGNADKEAEKLIPSPNFCVHNSFVLEEDKPAHPILSFFHYIDHNMSRSSRSLTPARLNDALLGCFGRLRPSETLDHLVRYLGTWSGSDKLFMVIQYAVKLIVPFLQLRARLQHRAGLRDSPKSTAAEGYAKLGSLLGDSRTLWRIWGLLPIIQWLISLERSPPATRNLLTIERLQGWSMLAYYPLEHIYYLGSHGIIPTVITSPFSFFTSKKRKFVLNLDTLGLWSCRFWAVYVILHFAHLFEDKKLLKQRHNSLRKAKGTGLTQVEKLEMRQRWDALWSEVVINLGYLPLTIHWSLERGLFTNDAWVGVFGLVAGLASFRAGWKATALPQADQSSVTPESSTPATPGYDVST